MYSSLRTDPHTLIETLMDDSAYQHRYVLHWSNGRDYQILVADEIREFLRPAIELTCLRPGTLPGGPRLYVHAAARPRGKRAEVTLAGWQTQSVHFWRYWFPPAGDEGVVAEIDLGFELSGQPIDSLPGGAVHGDSPILALRRWKVLGLYAPVLGAIRQSGGIHLHGGLVSVGGRGLILAGPSGVGKSTTCARLSHPWTVHCDDHVVLAEDPSSDGGGKALWWAHPWPTWSTFFANGIVQACDVADAVPLSALVFLEQARADEIVPLGVGVTAARLFASNADMSAFELRVVPPGERARHRALVVEYAARLARQAPGFILRLSRDGRFWERLEGLLATLP